MKAFEYVAPRSEAEVLLHLAARPGETEILAGGTDLIGLMNKMVITPDKVVNIEDIATLKTIETDSLGVTIGAAVTLEEVLEHPALKDYPAVLQAIAGINSQQLRAQGTIGGELCQRPRCWYFRTGQGLLAEQGTLVEQGCNEHHAIFGNSGPAKFVSSSRIAPALIALDAELRILGPDPDKESSISAGDLFRTPKTSSQRENTLLPNQFVTHITLPPLGQRRCATYEVRQSEGPDFPLAAAAAALVVRDGIVADCKIVLGQVAPTPWVSWQARQALIGRPLTHDTALSAGQAAVVMATPLSENEYKVQLAQVAVQRAILLAGGLETGGF